MKNDFEDFVGITESFSEAKIDKESNVIENVKLLGAVSRNNRRYTDRALNDAVEKYRGIPFMVDHPTKSQLRDRNGTRSVMDIAGKIINPRRVGDSVRGDIELLAGDPLTEKVKAIAAQMPEMAGNSHRARGTTTKGGNGEEVVESIDAVFAMELVSQPATTNGLFESTNDEGDKMDWTKVTLADLQTQRPDLAKSLIEGTKNDQQVETLKEENKNLRAEVDTLKAKDAVRERAALVEKKLEEAKLPDAVVTDQFRTQLQEAKDEKALDALIEDRKAIAAGLPTKKPTSKPKSFDRTPVTEGKDTDPNDKLVYTDKNLAHIAETIGVGTQRFDG